MKTAYAARIGYGVAVLLSAAILSGATTYLYGALFQHSRYWDGTIRRVQDIDFSLIEALLTHPRAAPLPERQEELAPLFRALDGKMAFELVRGEKVVYSNRIPGRATPDAPSQIQLADGASLLVYRYAPPSWGSEFNAWLSSPAEWWSRKYDRITAPFTSFLLIYGVFLYALAWRYRARHLSEEVLTLLRRPEEALK
jgi:hypothetical protein